MTDFNLLKRTIDAWADNEDGPVALHLKQELLPVEDESSVIFPPTYADIGYNIDTFPNGEKVATIDSVGSQANRLEPIFKKEPYSELVPQININLSSKKNENGSEECVKKLSLLDLAHRGADAVVLASPRLAGIIQPAFLALREKGDAEPLCHVAPTSLVFGFWDSRGESQYKCPRLVRSIIRAWDVEPLHAAAQFNSVWKALSEEQQEALKKEAETKKTKLSEKGFADAPAIFRKTKIEEFSNGVPNPEARVLGGVLVNGRIERDITVNLVALRIINGADDDVTRKIRRYLLGLTLIAATTDIPLYLREGCHLRFANEKDSWKVVSRRGEPKPVDTDLTSQEAQDALRKYTEIAVKPFKEKWPENSDYEFNVDEAKKLLAKKNEDEGNPA